MASGSSPEWGVKKWDQEAKKAVRGVGTPGSPIFSMGRNPWFISLLLRPRLPFMELSFCGRLYFSQKKTILDQRTPEESISDPEVKQWIRKAG